MNTIDCIKSRRSVRKFTEEKVPHEVLEQLVELARWAPSWKNTQIARYVAVEDEALKNRIAEEATIPWNEGIIKGAPVLMVMTYGLSGGGARRPQAQGSGGAADHQVKISPLLPNGGGGFLFLAWREYGPRNGCEKGNFPLTSPVLPVIIIELFHRQQARIGV